MTRLLRHPEVKPLLSDEHLSVDGTLIEAWASQKSFRPHDGSGGDGSDFHGQRRKNDTHASTADSASRLYRKAAGCEAKLYYMGHVIMEPPWPGGRRHGERSQRHCGAGALLRAAIRRSISHFEPHCLQAELKVDLGARGNSVAHTLAYDQK